MKITLIHGQNHKGSTYHIARLTAEKTGGDIEEFFLPKDFSGGCAGCHACLNKGREFCPRAEQVSPILNSMLASDVIIIGSPTYIMEMTGHIKCFLEHIFTLWLPHRPEEAMFSKTAVVISTAAGAGMKNVVKSLARQMFYLGIPKIYKLPFRVMAASWDGVNEKTKKKIDIKTDRTARKIIAKNKKASPGFKLKFLFNMMRKSQMNNDYALLDREYWEEKGWLGSKRPWK